MKKRLSPGQWVVAGLFLLAFLLALFTVLFVRHNLKNPETRRKLEHIYQQRTTLPRDTLSRMVAPDDSLSQ